MWIEMDCERLLREEYVVIPHARMWIEINNFIITVYCAGCHPPCEDVD